MIKSVLVDSREPEWAKQLQFNGLPKQVRFLDDGDYWLVCDDALVVVERKATRDFLNSLKDDRLFAQIHGTRKLTPWAYLALCGEVYLDMNGLIGCNGHQTEWKWESLQGALWRVQDMGVMYLIVPNDRMLEDTLLRLGNRDHGPHTFLPPREVSPASDGVTILASLPGIGLVRANTLIEYSGSPANALCDLTDTGSAALPGIGPGIKGKIRGTLGLEEGESLQKVSKNDRRNSAGTPAGNAGDLADDQRACPGDPREPLLSCSLTTARCRDHAERMGTGTEPNVGVRVHRRNPRKADPKPEGSTSPSVALG